jgi:predicted nucleic acid-binding Zn ribbon protein
MSSTLLRAGLWILILVLALYVLHESFEELPVGEFFAEGLMQKALAFAVLLIVGGLVTRMLEKGAKVVTKNRCAVCRTPIAPGAIYCRAHLRRVLHEEDERTHMTRIRRT